MIQTTIIVPIVVDTPFLLRLTNECLRNINRTVPRSTTQIILVDNGSLLAHNYQAETIIRNQRNEGFSRAINQGIAASKGEFICQVNNDVMVIDNWLPPLVGALNADLQIGAIRPLTQTEVGFESNSREFTFDQLDFHGFCFAMRRDIFDKVGFFDERFFAYCEDVDMWVRLRAQGFKLAKALGSRVLHLGGQTSTVIDAKAALKHSREMFRGKHGFDVFDKAWYSSSVLTL